MTSRDCGFLLLTGKLGDPNRKPLTTAQLRLLVQRYQLLAVSDENTSLSEKHLASMGIDKALSRRILSLLEDNLQLDAYLAKARKNSCIPITRTNSEYPLILRKRMGSDSPGCLWLKGDQTLLKKNAIALVGSRDLQSDNASFACEVGYQAARQGYVLISGNARGADITAQKACLEAGGSVISVIADCLADHPLQENVLYISEDDFDAPFSTYRALHRNRIIHTLGNITIAAQCTCGKGGTWSGSTLNLRHHWSPLFCYQDGSLAASELERLGATPIQRNDLTSLSQLSETQLCIF